MTGRRAARRSLLVLGCALWAASLAAGTALAHGGSLGSASRQSVTVPTWLVLATGGAAVGASFLMASLVTDRRFIADVESWRGGLPGSSGLASVGVVALRVVGLAALVVTVAVGLAGPQASLANLGLLVVWVGWWAGFTMTTYLLANAWPVLNPWRTVARALPNWNRSYPASLGVWPATVALLGFVWLEVVSPVADEPAVLAGVILVYSLATLAGALAFGTEMWFDRVDPIARVFDHYGHVAPLSRGPDGFSVRLPGSGLRDLPVSDRSEVAFVVALLWVTTFDGFVSTPTWRAVTETFSMVPLAVLYPLALVAGFALFLAVYYGASRASKRLADTYLTERELARRFAPSLVAIAAGYHFAHYLGYFLSLVPALATVAAAPLNPPLQVPLLALPSWFETVGMVAILVGHLLAIWVAHATAYDIFPGRLQAIRSQYPFIAVMVFYTMTSLWLLSQPEMVPP